MDVTELLVPALLGVGVALGAVLLVVAFRSEAPDAPVRGPRIARRRLSVPLPVLGGAAAALITYLVTGWIVGAALAGLATWYLPRVFGGGRRAADRIARTEAIAGWAEMLRDTLAGAAGLEEAMVATAAVAPGAIRDPVRRLAVRIRHERLVDALRRLADEVADPTADLVVTALSLASQRHARDLGGLLGSLAQSARAQAAMQQRVEAGRARTRSAVRMVTLFTVCFAGGMVVLNRGYLAPFDSTFGQLVLAVVGTGFGAAFVLLDRMARAGEPARVLVRDGAA